MFYGVEGTKMNEDNETAPVKLSIVIPCYNEEVTLKRCINRVLEIADHHLLLEIIVIDDGSTDQTPRIARELEKEYPEILLIRHESNRGKGAALRTGFQRVTGDYVAIQDADLEYDPVDLERLLTPLINGTADVVFGSRFLSTGAHRVLYFWHALGNRFLTFLSNMFTDLNLTDMETCYKVFRRDVIQGINIQEDRFGFEPEIVAKIAHMRLRVYETGISYRGRTYQEGKKIRSKDGVRALYCILRYNAHKAPTPMQLFLYLLIGGVASVVNFLVFIGIFYSGIGENIALPVAFSVAALVNYLLCIAVLFRHKARWNSPLEILIYILVVCFAGIIDLTITKLFIHLNLHPALSKIIATISVFVLNFLGRKFLVFPEPASGDWRPQEVVSNEHTNHLPKTPSSVP